MQLDCTGRFNTTEIENGFQRPTELAEQLRRGGIRGPVIAGSEGVVAAGTWDGLTITSQKPC